MCSLDGGVSRPLTLSLYCTEKSCCMARGVCCGLDVVRNLDRAKACSNRYLGISFANVIPVRNSTSRHISTTTDTLSRYPCYRQPSLG